MNFKNKFNYKKISKILIIFILILGTFIYEINFKTNLSKPEMFIKDAYYSILNIIKSPFLKPYVENTDSTILALESLILDKDKTIEELERLNDIVISKYQYINAVVIDRNLLFYNESLTINKGLNDNIKDDSLVISDKVLIGITKNCSSNFCDVVLITNNNKIDDLSVYITKEDSYIHGLLTEYDTVSNEFSVTNISDSKNDYINYKIITSGLSNYPGGILIGEVSSVSKSEYELENILKIKPAISFENISFVQVIVRSDSNDN